MKIHSVAAQDFLSFASLDLPLHPGATVITGPNGAGKSNLGAAIALPGLVLDHGLRGDRDAVDPLEAYQQAGRNGTDAYAVSLDLELDQPWEQELVRLFIEGAVAMAAIEQLSAASTPPANKAVLGLFVEVPVAAASIRSLLRGKLTVAYNARQHGPWWAAWNFRHAGQDMQLLLKGPGAGRLHRGHMPPWMDNLVAPFRTTIPPLGLGTNADKVPRVDELTSMLQHEDSPRAGTPQPSSVDFGSILDSLDQTVAFSLDVPSLANSNVPQPVSLGLLARLLGFEQRSQTRFDFRFILAEVLRRGLTVTDNRRLPLKRHFPLADLRAPVDLCDGSGLAGELYRLKNGDLDEQRRFERVREIFREIAGLDLHLRSLPMADPHLAVDVLVGEGGQDRSIQFAGAGIQETLFLATLIAGAPGSVIVLDEPAVNLHPTMQRRLARQLAEIHGVVITHSPDLVPCSRIEDLDRLVRLTPRSDGTHVAKLPGENRARLGEWLQKLNLSDVRALLFASAVILCEGATDLGALGWWWQDGAASAASLDPQGANIAMIDVGGDNNFGGYVNYLEAFQIPWTAVADGPAFQPTSGLSRQLNNLGLAPADGRPDPDNEDFSAWRAYWNRAGVFTVADTFGGDPEKSGEFEAFLERQNSALLTQMRELHNKSKPRVGAAFAAAHPAPQEVVELYRQIHQHIEDRMK
ncbi:AAA family ATPase [Streptomyces sp. NPDC060187]|uniref:AAA family ATPase n=1 Tax=Streptomyces sp. NPDC060187 TaxID=3347067 RepID=UPI00365D71EE